jgi:hypothetical protein
MLRRRAIFGSAASRPTLKASYLTNAGLFFLDILNIDYLVTLLQNAVKVYSIIDM